jgi:hypothetical protein
MLGQTPYFIPQHYPLLLDHDSLHFGGGHDFRDILVALAQKVLAIYNQADGLNRVVIDYLVNVIFGLSYSVYSLNIRENNDWGQAVDAVARYNKQIDGLNQLSDALSPSLRSICASLADTARISSWEHLKGIHEYTERHSVLLAFLAESGRRLYALRESDPHCYDFLGPNAPEIMDEIIVLLTEAHS